MIRSSAARPSNLSDVTLPRRVIAVLLLSLASLLWTAGSSKAVSYDIFWQGGGGYTLEGVLTFDDALLNTGAIDESQISDLSLEVFLNGVSIATSAFADIVSSAGDPFNLNFDTNTEMFLVGGSGQSANGQAWNIFGVGAGFASGTTLQGVSIDQVDLLGQINTSASTLSATRQQPQPVPVPASLPVLMLGLATLAAFSGRVRQRAGARLLAA